MAKKVLHPMHPVNKNPKWAEKVYDDAKHPWQWWNSGRRLKDSARVLFEREKPLQDAYYAEWHKRIASGVPEEKRPPFDHQRFPQGNFYGMFVLTGFAMENFLKGIAIANGFIDMQGTKLPKDLKEHDLIKLQKLSRSTTYLEPAHLHLLTDKTIWSGRYPMPLNYEDLWKMNENGVLLNMAYRSDAPDEIMQHLDNLDNELQQLIQKHQST